MSVIYHDKKRGKDIVLLNPSEKRNKAFRELKDGIRLTNTGKVKNGNNGKPLRLTNEGRAYRAGYIKAQDDSAGCFKQKNPRYKRKIKY